jgi:putative Ca2+/H+ antiporter (TMEM165/GDT1 family)
MKVYGFAANPDVTKVGVFVAAAGALVVSTALAVLIGTSVGDWVSPGLLSSRSASGSSWPAR